MMNVKLLQSCTMLSVLVLVPVAGFALPTGGSVVGGDTVATIVDKPNKTVINQYADKAIIDWDTFNIENGETVRFKQAASDVALNRIHDADASKIFGTLRADGTVMLVNANGFVFGQNSKVDVGSLVATSANIGNDQFTNATDTYKFNHAGAADASIKVREGAKITVRQGGFAALVAPSVVNRGVIKAKLGKVSLGGGEKFTLDLMGDGLVNLQVPTASNGEVKQTASGKIMANGGTVQLTAKAASNVVDSVINMDGIVQANTVATHDGRIVLDADDMVHGANLETHTKQVELRNDKLKIDDDGIALVDAGGTVKLGKGTFTTDHTIEVDKSVTLQGKGKNAGGTVIDAAGAGGVGIRVTADDTTLRGFHLQDGSLNVEGGASAGQKVNNVKVANVAVTAPGQLAEIQAFGVDGLHLNGVDVDGGGSSLVGIGIVDSSNVSLNDISTQGNWLAGVALLALGDNVDNVRLTGNNTYGEGIALATAGLGGDVTRVAAQGLNYQTESGDLASAHIGLYHTDRQAAVDTALLVNGLSGGTDAVVEGLDTGAQYLTGDNHFYVGQNGGYQMSIQAALDAVQDNGMVEVLGGTYTLGSTLNMHKTGVTLQGQSLGGTVLDASGIGNNYGILVDGNGSKLNKFTLLGGDGGSANYGIKVQGIAGTDVSGIKLWNLKVQNFGRSEVDINGANGVDINNVTADGMNTQGNGIAITDSHNVQLQNTKTLNNTWGGVRVSAGGGWFPAGSSNITLKANSGNNFQEANPFYTESINGGVISDIKAAEFDYKLHSDAYDATKSDATHDVVQYLYQRDPVGQAVDFALNTMGTDSTIEGLEENPSGFTVGNNNWYVGQNGSGEMSIQRAVDAATAGGIVNVLDGTYDLSAYPFHYLYVNKALTLNGNGQANTTLDGSADSSYGVRVLADDVTLQNFTVKGPTSFGANGPYAVKVEVVDPAISGPTVDHFTMNNVTAKGSAKTQIDINNVTYAKFNNVTAIGNGVNGNGFGVTDSYDVRFNNVTTQNNGWGGIRLSARYGDTSKVSLKNSHLGEAEPMYTEQYPGHVVKDIYFPTMKFTVHSALNDAGEHNIQTVYQTSEANALAFADNWIAHGKTDAVIQGNKLDGASHNTGNNQFYVDGNMDIVSALAEAQTGGLVHLYNATYTVASPLDLGGKDIAFVGTGEMPEADGGTVIDASTLTDAFTNGSETHSDLLLLLAGGGSGGSPDDLMVRETTRRNSGFAGGNGGIGGGDAFSLIEPAAGEGSSNEKKDIADSPLQQQDLAVAQYFINTGQVVDQQYAVQALLADAALNGK